MDTTSFPRPTTAQLSWQEAQLGIFFHFDIEVFTWGRKTGAQTHPSHDARRNHSTANISPTLFNPVRLDTDQWLEVARSLGARYAVFTAKHDSGFLMWQSNAYPYGVRQAPWKDGKGDVVRQFVDSCRRFGIAPGLYCSGSTNAYLHEESWHFPGASPGEERRKIRILETMYTELWSRYGQWLYMFFDGGVRPSEQGGPDLLPLIRRLQPNMVCFQGPSGVPGGLARWAGNETGLMEYPCWNTTDSTDQIADRGHGDPNGRYWIPVEADVPLRYHHWMWRPDDVNDILSLDALTEIYLHSIGRGSNLIINANIDPEGRVPGPDAARFAEFGSRLREWFGRPLAAGGGEGNLVTVRLASPHVANYVVLEEDLRDGQRVRSYIVEGLVEGQWQTLCQGESIGRKRIQEIPALSVAAVRVRTTKSSGNPLIRKLAVFHVERC